MNVFDIYVFIYNNIFFKEFDFFYYFQRNFEFDVYVYILVEYIFDSIVRNVCIVIY